jgi:hypothetical protein
MIGCNRCVAILLINIVIKKTHKTFSEEFILSENNFNYNYLLSNSCKKSLEKVLSEFVHIFMLNFE